MPTAPSHALLLASLAVTALAACDAVSATSDTVASIDTLPSGAIHLTLAPDARDRVPQWQIVEELRIGEIDGTGPDVFAQVRSIAVDDEGRIYVLDATPQEIRIFDGRGRHLRTVGRRGEGPGEFRRANGLVRAGDAIYAYDQQNQRLTAIRNGGDSVSSQPLFATSWGWFWGAIADAAGRIYESVHVLGQEGAFIRRVDPATGVADTFAVASPGMPTVVSVQTPQRGGSTLVGHTPVGMRAFDRAGRMWMASTGRYALHQLSLETGDTVRIIEFSAPPVPVTAEERAREIARIDSFISRYGATWDRSLIPSTKPPLQYFTFDDQGRIWVRVTAPGEERRFDILDPDGRLLATATTSIPLSTRPEEIVIRGDAIHAIVRDDLDVSYIVRAGIGRGR